MGEESSKGHHSEGFAKVDEVQEQGNISFKTLFMKFRRVNVWSMLSATFPKSGQFQSCNLLSIAVSIQGGSV